MDKTFDRSFRSSKTT